MYWVYNQIFMYTHSAGSLFSQARRCQGNRQHMLIQPLIRAPGTHRCFLTRDNADSAWPRLLQITDAMGIEPQTTGSRNQTFATRPHAPDFSDIHPCISTYKIKLCDNTSELCQLDERWSLHSPNQIDHGGCSSLPPRGSYKKDPWNSDTI